MTLVVFEAILLATWLAGAIYIVANLEIECFEVQFVVHFLILVHFALAAYLLTVVAEISKAQENYKRKHPSRELTLLPYTFYLPVVWIGIALLSLVGDIILLVGGIRLYTIRSSGGGINEDAKCQTSRLAHIIYDGIATLISLVTIVWFIIYTLYTIKVRHSRNLVTRTQSI